MTGSKNTGPKSIRSILSDWLDEYFGLQPTTTTFSERRSLPYGPKYPTVERPGLENAVSQAILSCEHEPLSSIRERNTTPKEEIHTDAK